MDKALPAALCELWWSELGWSTLKTRRKLHRLLLYRKIIATDHNRVPLYVITLLPRSRQDDTNRSLRNADHQTQLRTRTTAQQRSFFILTGKQWNELPEITRTLSYHEFKKDITKHLCTQKPPLYYSYGPKHLNIMHTRIRTGMTQLNEHMYKIQKSTSPNCTCGHPHENEMHFIFSCTKYNQQRDTLYNSIRRSIFIFIFIYFVTFHSTPWLFKSYTS